MDSTISTRTPRDRVLVIVRFNDRGPWLEVYGDKRQLVHIHTVPYAPTRSSEELAEDLLELQLPHRYRYLYSSDKLLGHDVVRRVLPSELTDTDHQVQILRGLAALDDHLTIKPTEVIEWIA